MNILIDFFSDFITRPSSRSIGCSRSHQHAAKNVNALLHNLQYFLLTTGNSFREFDTPHHGCVYAISSQEFSQAKEINFETLQMFEIVVLEIK